MITPATATLKFDKTKIFYLTGLSTDTYVAIQTFLLMVVFRFQKRDRAV